MMRKVFFLFLSLLAFSVASEDRLTQVLKKELKLARRLFVKKPTARNDYRVFSIRTELIKIYRKELNELMIKNKSEAKISEYKKKTDELYKITKAQGYTINKRYGNFKDKGKFSLIFGLLLSSFEPENKNIEKILQQAIKFTKERDLKHLASGKLADFYFNKGKFSFAEKYYKNAIKIKKKSEWNDKYWFNLGWSQFKNQDFKNAVISLKTLYDEHNDKYFKKQAIQKIPLFLIYAGNPKEAFNFVKSNHDRSVQSYLSFIKLIYDKGFFKELDNITFTLEKKLKKSQRAEFLIGVYEVASNFDFSQYYDFLMKLRKKIDKYSLKNKKDREIVFRIDNKILNNHLEVINREAFSIEDKRDNLFYTDATFLLERFIGYEKKPSKRTDLYLKLSRIHYKAGKLELAFKVLYEFYKSKKVKIAPSLEGKVLRQLILASQSNKVKIEKSEKIDFFNYFINISKNKKDKKVIYLKLFDIYYDDKDYDKSFELAKKFYSENSSDNKNMEIMLLKLLSAHLVANEVPKYNNIKRYILTKPNLKSRKEIKKMLSHGYQNLVLYRINKLSSNDGKTDLGTANKLRNYFNNTKIDRVNRFLAGFKAVGLFIGLGKINEALGISSSLLSQTRNTEFPSYEKSFNALAIELEEKGDFKSSNSIMMNVLENSCRLNDSNFKNNLLDFFERNIIKNNWNIIYNTFNKNLVCVRKTIEKRDVWKLFTKYINLNNFQEFKRFSKFINFFKFNDPGFIDLFSEKLVSIHLSQLSKINIDIIRNKIRNVGVKYWMRDQLRSSLFFKELFYIINRKKQILEYKVFNLNDQNIGAYIEQNISIFTNNLEKISSIKTSYLLSSMVKKMYELDIIQTFFNDIINIDHLVSDPERLEAYKQIISTSINPLENRIKVIQQDIDTMNNNSHYGLFFQNFNSKFKIIKPKIEYIIMDKRI